MQTEAKPNATDDRRDFVVIPPDQVRVAPSDAEITDLLRAAARHQPEAGVRAAPDVPVPAVDKKFRATAVNDDVLPRGPTFGRRAMRAVAALLLAMGIGAAALSWQTVGYAARKAVFKWAPQWAITASLPLEMLGLSAKSNPSDATPPALDAASAPDTAGSGATGDTTANSTTAPSDAAQQLKSMAHDLASANQEVETLKASIAELKATQQQMARDLAKVSDKVADQNAKAKIAAATQHAAVAVRKPAPLYSPTPSPAAPPPAYRPSYSAQASVAPASPSVTAQPNVPPPISLQPQAEPGLSSAPRPPMPMQ